MKGEGFIILSIFISLVAIFTAGEKEILVWVIFAIVSLVLGGVLTLKEK